MRAPILTLSGVARSALASALLVVGCQGGPSPGESNDELNAPGALVSAHADSTVGVVLDEIPADIRDRAANDLLQKPDAFWTARAIRQMNLTTYRLVFRENYYPGENRQQLPLPPDGARTITLSGKPHRDKVDGHDVVRINYSFDGVLLTTPSSPGITEPNLAKVGGKRVESFTLPVDPELVFQRTRYACMDEAEFPPLSVDSEEVDSFYDDSCNVEPQLTQTGCHQTELPPTSCVDAVKAKIGRAMVNVTFQRLPWDAAVADKARVGAIVNPTGANLTPEQSEFRVNRLTYRYFEPNDCALTVDEGPCVGGTGWRRLLQFATADRNTGTKQLNIGAVDYFISGSGSPLSNHNVFEFSACHHHYHFRHYGAFTFDSEPSPQKRGFCLQSTNRFSNNEYSPLHNPYGDCGYQGIEVGWVDEYKAGLPCQWKDVTGIDASKGPVKGTLGFVSNPDGFLCEGTPVLDQNGNPVFEPTNFTTQTGAPVDRMKCDFFQNWAADNGDSYQVTIPPPGDGYVTAACPHDAIGPLRNCQLQKPAALSSCTPGKPVQLHCQVARGAAPQVVRVCEGSVAIGQGTACTYQDALANVTTEGTPAVVTFTCPAARDQLETGGSYALYTGPAFNDDPSAPVSCRSF